MTIAIDNTTTDTIANTESGVTFSHTVTAVGQNLLLVVAVHILNNNSEEVVSITYDGESLTLLDAYDEGTDSRVELWYLYSPSTGANNVVVTTDTLDGANSAAVVSAVSFTGAHQAEAFGTVVKNNSTDEGDTGEGTVTVSTSAGEYVLGICTANNGGPFTSSGTEQYDTSSGNCDGVMSYDTDASSVTLTWTLATSSDWAAMAVAVAPEPEFAPTRDRRIRSVSNFFKNANVTDWPWGESFTVDANQQYLAEWWTWGSMDTIDYQKSDLVDRGAKVVLGDGNTGYFYQKAYNPFDYNEKTLHFAIDVLAEQGTTVYFGARLMVDHDTIGDVGAGTYITKAISSSADWQTVTGSITIPDITAYDDGDYDENSFYQFYIGFGSSGTPWTVTWRNAYCSALPNVLARPITYPDSPILSEIAAQSPAEDVFIYFDGDSEAALHSISQAGRLLVGNPDVVTMRDTLGLGSIATATETNYLLADGSRSLSSNWDIGDGLHIATDQIRARDGAGLLLTDDGNNGIFVEDGGNVGIGTASPNEKLEINGSIRIPAVGSSIKAGSNRIVYRDGAALYIGGIDADSLALNIRTNAANRLHITSGGNIGIGTTSPSAKLHVDQSSTTAAIPVLYLDQADVSEEMIEFNTTIGTGNAIEAVGAKTLTTTHFIKVTIPGGLTRYIPVGTIA